MGYTKVKEIIKYIHTRNISLFEIGIPNWCVDASWDGGVSHAIFRSLRP